jgi:hypothetical protein
MMARLSHLWWLSLTALWRAGWEIVTFGLWLGTQRRRSFVLYRRWRLALVEAELAKVARNERP